MIEAQEALERAAAQNEPIAKATVVNVAGSAYRREGAWMAVTAAGEMHGTISGGCLEGEVRQAALEVLASGEPRFLHFDMTADDDAVWGLGLGCNGRIDVYIEAVPPPGSGAEEAPTPSADAAAKVAATVVWTPAPSAAGGADGVRVGAVMHLDDDGPGGVRGSTGDPALDELVRKEALELAASGASRSRLFLRAESGGGYTAVKRPREIIAAREAGRGIQVYFDSRIPRPTLLVLGAGHDAIPLTRMGSMAGFRVVVADSRRAYATRDRFPDADEVIVTRPGDLLQYVTVDEFTYIVVMTHNYNHDGDLLKAVWGLPYAYLGQLGPWERTERLLADVAEHGKDVDAHLDRLYGPIGMDIGAEGPEQIAIAIMAEVLAVKTRRPGGFLRFRKGSLHALRAGDGGQQPAGD